MEKILSTLKVKNLGELMDKTVPSHIRLKKRLQLPEGISEVEALSELKKIMSGNEIWKSFIGQGYYNTITPTVILRNIIENPSWYTPYTPYQAEIAQGRLEMLLNFQTMVSDLVGKPLCNASLLDEATSCAEAVHMAWSSVHGLTSKGDERNTVLVSENVHIQNIAVIQTRSEPLGIQVKIVKDNQIEASLDEH
ncbi:glycine dehydrogenase, partial [Reticulomyxa filosa]